MTEGTKGRRARWRKAALGLRWLSARLLAGLGLAMIGCGGGQEAAGPEPRPPSIEAPFYDQWPFDEAEAKRRQEETAKKLELLVEARVQLADNVSLDLVLIPAGRFRMGLKGAELNEPRDVEIRRAFYMGKCEMTWRQYAVFKQRSNPTNLAMSQMLDHDKNSIDKPVDAISWRTCQSFCRDASAKLGCTMRLPTEAEWEYACRAGTTGRFIHGDALGPEDANSSGYSKEDGSIVNLPIRGLQKSGMFRPNPLKLYDMIGNVEEWVQDKYNKDEFVKVLRGGAYHGAWTVAERHMEHENSSNAGFRVVVEIDGKTSRLLRPAAEKPAEVPAKPSVPGPAEPRQSETDAR